MTRKGPLTWVELRGFEPLASSLRTRRATNCATAPGRACCLATQNINTPALTLRNRPRTTTRARDQSPTALRTSISSGS
jgi:hypothetical protein